MLLAGVDALPASEIAARFDTDEATVQPSVDHAGAFQRARLLECGGAPTDTGRRVVRRIRRAPQNARAAP